MMKLYCKKCRKETFFTGKIYFSGIATRQLFLQDGKVLLKDKGDILKDCDLFVQDGIIRCDECKHEFKPEEAGTPLNASSRQRIQNAKEASLGKNTESPAKGHEGAEKS